MVFITLSVRLAHGCSLRVPTAVGSYQGRGEERRGEERRGEERRPV
jgi:hypothetical protein